MPLLETPFAQLDLIRQPEQQNEPLQAFDAADEYLLNHLASEQPASSTRVLVLNDSFGALAISLLDKVEVSSSGDSFLGFVGLEKNLLRNGQAFDAIRPIPASEPLVGPFDRVLIRVPKTLALLEEQLIRLQGQLAPGAQVIAAAMVINMCAAGLAGVLIPLTLDSLGDDPAVATSVFVKAITDVLGFFAFLGLAAWWFGLW